LRGARPRHGLNAGVRRKLNDATAAVRQVVLAGAVPAGRLRLGWLYLVNNSAARARSRSTSLRERTPMGCGIWRICSSARLRNARAARTRRTEFASAHAVLPEAQSAVVACLRTARTSGRAEVIPRLLAEYARPRRQTPADPWWYFSMGVTGSERLMWLRRQATGT
jgi:hypothetical protein